MVFLSIYCVFGIKKNHYISSPHRAWIIKKRWKCPKIGHFIFISQQKANQNQWYVFLRSPPAAKGGSDLQLKKISRELNPDDIIILSVEDKVRQFSLLKKLSRDLNYDVIIERTREGILCRDNHQDGRRSLIWTLKTFVF